MKKLLFVTMMMLLAHAASAGDWKLVWSDEFDYEGLPNPEKWDYEVGFVRNQELQYYTKAREENARVEKGNLVIEGRKEQFRNPAYKADAKNWQGQREFASYTAASVITRHMASWKYGRIEIRAQLPQGQGVWPAIWMMGANRGKVRWPHCGEIDIMEFVGKSPNLIYGTAHFPGDDGKHRSNGGKIKTERPSDDFHIYAIEWNEERIDFYFDKTKYHSFKIDQAGEGADNPFRKPHYLLINLALGGSWGGPVGDTVLPQQYLIDYVRVYELSMAEESLKVGDTDVATVLKQLGAKMEQGASREQLDDYAQHFDRIDRDHDGKHSKSEYVEKGRYLTPLARAGIFNAADGDADGVVTKAEYVLNRIITDEAKLIMQAMDDNKDGKVQRDEFIKIAMEDKKLAARVFDALDANGDGELTTPEYLRVWGRWARAGQPSAEKRIASRERELAGADKARK